MKLATRDPFGAHRVCYTSNGVIGPSVRNVLATHSGSVTLDLEAVRQHALLAPLQEHTLVEEVRQLLPSHELHRGGATLTTVPYRIEPELGSIEEALQTSIDTSLQQPDIALALSGGLDSALVLAMLLRTKPSGIPAYILDPQWGDYSECDRALATARLFGIDASVVTVHESDFVAALPDALLAIEEPLFNLHPVSRMLLARAMARDGFKHMLTGDAADHVFKRDYSANYLPLVVALAAAEGVETHTPFLSSQFVSRAMQFPPDPQKLPLRQIAAKYGIDEPLVAGPKRSKFAPHTTLATDHERARLQAMASLHPPGSPFEQTVQDTLVHLLRAMKLWS